MGIVLESAARLNALTAKANAVTGAADTKLAPAVERLIAGFGQGGGSGGGNVSIPGILEITGGDFTPASDVSTMNISHGLSQAPQIAFLSAEENIGNAQLLYSVTVKHNQSDVPTISLTAATGNADTRVYWSNAYNQRGGISDINDTDIVITKGNTEKFLKAGIKYKWVAVVSETAWDTQS